LTQQSSNQSARSRGWAYRARPWGRGRARCDALHRIWSVILKPRERRAAGWHREAVVGLFISQHQCAIHSEDNAAEAPPHPTFGGLLKVGAPKVRRSRSCRRHASSMTLAWRALGLGFHAVCYRQAPPGGAAGRGISEIKSCLPPLLRGIASACPRG